MISVEKKLINESNSNVIGSANMHKNTLDNLFAELFSLVNLNSIEDIEQEFNPEDNINPISSLKEGEIENNDEGSLNVAKSLISIFYKDYYKKMYDSN